MKAINLFVQTRVREEYFGDSYRVMSDSDDSVKSHEFRDILQLVDRLMAAGADIYDLDGFFYSYRIPHISKEFDLLKIEPGKLNLNIELKSQAIEPARVKKQLLQNRSYLKHLNTNTKSFTYVSEEDCLYCLKEDELVLSSFEELAEVLKQFDGKEIRERIEEFFRPNVFLVSPLTQPEKLLSGEYFLTDQQERFKQDIMDSIEDSKSAAGLYAITGEPGTGKTLLLYDIALSLAGRGRCCMIHGAMLSEGHRYISEHCEGLTVLAPNQLSYEVLSSYDYIFADEMQRIEPGLSELMMDFLGKKPIIISYDADQILSVAEERLDELKRMETKPGCQKFRLTNSLRINKNIASFYKVMFDRRETPRGVVDFSCVDVIYAEDEASASQILRLYTGDKYGYRFLYCTGSADHRDFLQYGTQTHQIIGQEFASVITLVDEHFFYREDGKLSASSHENGVYDYVRMLYQNVTRTRERLCILVYKNTEVYAALLEIMNRYR